MKGLPPQIEPFDKPIAGPHRSSRLNSPLRSLRHQVLETLKMSNRHQRHLSQVF